MGVGDVSKRILLGRKLRSSQLEQSLLPKKMALPVFASDAFSSVAYAPDEIFIMLSLAGVSAYAWSWKVGLAVALVMIAVIASYRQTVQAYPGGGGDYEVARANLGRTAGTTVASALLVDYVLTVAVSISAGAQYAASAVPGIEGYEVPFACAMVLVLTALNLRGIQESAPYFAVLTYLFVAAVLGMGLYGLIRLAGGDLPLADSASLQVEPAAGFAEPLTTVGLLLLLARAFSSGCVALTGVESISNGVPAFRRPKGRNAATTLVLLGAIAITMMMSVIVLARQMQVQLVDPYQRDRLLAADGSPLPDDFHQDAVLAQIAKGVLDTVPGGFYVIVVLTGTILVIAANTAFNGFPVLGSILAEDGLAPKVLASRGDRLAFSNGIVFLAVLSIVLIWAFDAETTRLIQLYIVGVFVSFTVSQLGMVRHWRRQLARTREPAGRRRILRNRAVNAVGLVLTAVVLVVVLVTKFTYGAWIAVLAMLAFFALMTAIQRHYDRVGLELAVDEQDRVMPTRVHAMVLTAKLHKPTLRALAFARATRPNVLEAVYVDTDPVATAELMEEWDERGLDVPLKVLHSPYREVIRPVVDYAQEIRRNSPRGVVAVYIPEYVVGRWWERLLHNQTALRLKGRLLFSPGVMVISVPYQLSSSQIAKDREARAGDRALPGDLRRGRVRREDRRQVRR